MVISLSLLPIFQAATADPIPVKIDIMVSPFWITNFTRSSTTSKISSMPSTSLSVSMPSSMSTAASRIPLNPFWTALETGAIFSASSALVSSKSAVFSLASTRSLLLLRQASPSSGRPWRDNSSSTMLARSLLSAASSSLVLNSSSLVPAQFSTSANVPVTTPACIVSLIASDKLSIGILSPYVAQAPMAALATSVSCSCSKPIACRFAVVVAAVCGSAKTPYRFL